MQQLRTEADVATERAETAEAKIKKLEQLLLEKEQEVTSLSHKLEVTNTELDAAEAKLADAKTAKEDSEQSKSTNEALLRKIQLLEEELDAAEKNAKETTEKYVVLYPDTYWSLLRNRACRLRQVDISADHFKLQAQNLERERDRWEQKYEVRPILIFPWSMYYLTRIGITGIGDEAQGRPSRTQRPRCLLGEHLIGCQSSTSTIASVCCPSYHLVLQ